MTKRRMNGANKEGCWSLNDLFPATSGPEIEAAFREIEAAAVEIESRRPALVPEIDETVFSEVLEWIEKLARITQKVDGYAVLRFFADTGDPEALALRGRIENVEADTKNRTVFFDLWWKALDDENAQRLLRAAGDNAYYLERLRSFAPYTLSEAEEKLINTKNVNGTDGLVTLYTMIVHRLTYDFENEGERMALTRSELMDYTRDPSPDCREAAYRAYLGGFEAHIELAQIYRHIANDWHAEKVDLRGFSAPISFRNIDNDIPDEVVAELLEVCRENTALYQRYYKLKARWLGLSKLRRFDLLAPLEDVEAEYPFAESAEFILNTFRAFSPKLAELAEKVLSEKHIDWSIRPGKRGGGLSWDALPGMTPWILVNYGGRASDVTTLAHELGHAVHALMAADHSVLTFSPPLPMAETASSFAQILLLDAMLEGADSKLRRTLLARYIEDSYTQILRQAYCVLFEQEAHRMIPKGATTEEISAAYLGYVREQFGDSVDVDECFKHEWIGFAHYYRAPFYDYAYAFGLLLVLGLYKQYKKEGNTFEPKYLKLLAYGGSKKPIDVLDEVGFDIRKRAFWQGGFDILAGMVDELEGIC